MTPASARKIRAIREHRLAYRQCSRSYLGCVTAGGWLHDLDKIFLLRLGLRPELVSKLHRKWSLHHDGTGFVDRTGAVIDWECARYTKPDKPLNARETLAAHYPDHTKKLKPVIDRLGL